MAYLNALEMCSRQGTIRIHVYLILSYQTTIRAQMLSIGAKGMGLPMSESSVHSMKLYEMCSYLKHRTSGNMVASS